MAHVSGGRVSEPAMTASDPKRTEIPNGKAQNEQNGRCSMAETMKWPLCLLGISLLLPSPFAHSEGGWLEPALIRDWGTNYKQLPATSYLDLGSDPQALKALESKAFVLDRNAEGPSLALSCSPPNQRYLMRALSLGNHSLVVYEGANGLIVSVGDFTEPRSPERSAMAICLPSEPHDVRASVGFAK